MRVLSRFATYWGLKSVLRSNPPIVSPFVLGVKTAVFGRIWLLWQERERPLTGISIMPAMADIAGAWKVPVEGIKLTPELPQTEF